MSFAPRAGMHRVVPAALAGLLALAAGCAHRAAPPPGHAPALPRPAAGYERRLDDLAAIDSAALAGRRIALDPGHGGFFRGSIGVHGLTEAEVNLGVALVLRGLLEARGARVFMTRTDDRDFLTPADSSLKADLAERSRLANAFHPELFLSIHHNADAGGAHDRNEIQTYYKLGDEGPSLDAAAAVHRYLVRNLAIEKHRVLPGNYFVLRSSDSPALLTEASYLTNPEVENQLALASKQRLEAEALLLGIAKFFARKAPSIAAFEAVHALDGSRDSVFAEAGPLLRARIEGAFDRAELRLDGRAMPVERRGAELEWRPLAPLAQGPHRAALRVRLAAQGAAPERERTFEVRRPARSLRAALWPGRLPWSGGLLGVRVEVLDGFGLPVLDSVGVRLRLPLAKPNSDSPAETAIVARDGVAWGYARIAPRRLDRPVGRRSVSLTARLAGDHGASAAEASEISVALEAMRDSLASTGAFLRVMPGDLPLLDAPGTRDGSAASWLSRDGFATLALDSTRRAEIPTLAGYRLWADSTSVAGLPLRWVAIASGALHGKRITLDPDGGGDDPAGEGRSGARAASFNLEVARAVAGMLEAAGADVKLTRSGDDAISEVERVQASEAFHADRYLKIGHRAESPRFGAFPASPSSRRWAERAAREFARLGLEAPPITDDAQYPLQQTSCPALFVSAARIDRDEERLLAPGTLRAEAYAMFLSLAREFAPEASWPSDSLELRDPAGKPVAGAPVTLGGALVLESDALGRARFARTESGPMMVEVSHPRVHARAVLLDSDRGVVLTGPHVP